jgi:hypothetical protein
MSNEFDIMISNGIKTHQTCIEILEGIQQFKRLGDVTFESMVQLKEGLFPELEKKYLHQLDIYERCIERLNERYYNVINKHALEAEKHAATEMMHNAEGNGMYSSEF